MKDVWNAALGTAGGPEFGAAVDVVLGQFIKEQIVHTD